MAYVIAKPCIGVKDTACVAICPCDCIHPTRDETDFDSAEQLYIDPQHCIDCGLCVAECPVAAIFPRMVSPLNGATSSRRTPRTSAELRASQKRGSE